MLCGFFSLISLGVSPDLKLYFARRSAGFVIRRQKRFDLLKLGGVVIPLSINSILACCGLQIRKAKIG